MDPSEPRRNADDLIANVRAQVQAAKAKADALHTGSSNASAEAVRSAAARILAEPASIDGYEILSEHHRGGQGIVYRALQRATRREVALKVLHSGALGGRAGRARFEREVTILGQLRHPNIVTIHDSAAAGERYWYAMDFVDGDPLDTWIIDRDPEVAAGARSVAREVTKARMSGTRGAGTLKLGDVASTAARAGPGGITSDVAVDRTRNSTSIRDVLRLFAKICSAVHAAHVRGVIHRDLKPANILIDRQGEPKVVDFGLAKLADSSDATHILDAAMTQTGQFVGSLPWSSPEQAGGHEVDTRSDVYALGVVLFQMLTGQFPYSVVGPAAETLHNIRERDPIRPSTLRRGISDEVDTIVLRCLAKDRERRYQSAGELGRDIERYLAGEPIEAKRDSAVYLLKKALARYRVPLLVSAAFVVVLAAGGVAATLLWIKAAEERDRAHRAELRAGNRFEQLRHLAHAFIFEFDDRLRLLPGTLETRRLLTQSAQQYLDSLTADAGDDAGLLKELALEYRKIGDVLGYPEQPNLGEWDKAEENYEKSRQLLLRLRELDPANLEYRYMLAIDHMRRGLIARIRNDLPKALAELGSYHDEVAAVGLLDPNTGYQRELATAKMTIGDILTMSKRFDEARAILQESIQILAGLKGDDPNIAGDLLHDRAGAFCRLGDVFLEQEKVDDAMECYQRALACDEENYRHDDQRQYVSRDLTVDLYRVGKVHALRSEFDEAEPLMRRALSIREDLLVKDPRSNQAARDVAVANFNLAELLDKRRNSAGRTVAQKLADLRDMRTALIRTKEVFDGIRARGAIRPVDDATSQGLPADIEEVTQQIRELEAASASQPAADGGATPSNAGDKSAGDEKVDPPQ